MSSLPTFTRLIRFLPPNSTSVLIGQPVDPKLDVGLATYDGKDVEVEVYSGHSILSSGEKNGKMEKVGKLLSPLGQSEVGTIRCIGLNYTKHAKETGLDLPTTPTLFMKPSTALGNPYPDPTIIPKTFVEDGMADYESELAVIIGRECKNVSEGEALDYVLGYTAANDVSSRKQQFAQSQWSYSKSFDGACPLGPTIVHASQVKRVEDLQISGTLNGKIVQQSGLDDLIFSVPKIISFLSQGTTLPVGTVIITGTPAGVGYAAKPQTLLKDGDVFRVLVSHGVGTLINEIVEEK